MFRSNLPGSPSCSSTGTMSLTSVTLPALRAFVITQTSSEPLVTSDVERPVPLLDATTLCAVAGAALDDEL